MRAAIDESPSTRFPALQDLVLFVPAPEFSLVTPLMLKLFAGATLLREQRVKLTLRRVAMRGWNVPMLPNFHSVDFSW